MARHPKVWLREGSITSEARVSAFTIDCPFCGEAVGPVISLRIMPGAACACGARVVSVSATEQAASAPEILGEAYRVLKRRLAERVSGHEDILSRLALMGARHLHSGGRQRALLVGPSGVGKTTIGIAMAEALECPAVVWDVSVSSEVGWSGISVSDVLAEMYTAHDGDLDWLSRTVLIADEIDKLAIQGAQGSSREHRVGQQKSLLGILGGGVPTRFQAEGDRGRTLAVRTDHMLILGLGAFHGLPEDAGAGDLVRYGFSVEFASRFPVILTLSTPGPDQLVPILRREIEGALAGAAEFGFSIEVPDAVLRYVARGVCDAGPDVTPRAGAGWLTSAVDAALLRLIDLEAKPGTRIRLRADDVPVPAALRRV